MQDYIRFSSRFGYAVLLLMVLVRPVLTGSVAAAGREEPEGLLHSELQALVVDPAGAGEAEWSRAETVKPGNLVEYRLLYRNMATETLHDIIAIGPIVRNTFYVDASATAGVALLPHFSIDGGRTFHPEPVMYEVELADGSRVQRQAAADMYTHVRWHITRLEPRTETELRYRVRVR